MSIDKKIINFIESKPANYWDFSARKKTNLEKCLKYPAKMVSGMQEELLNIFLNSGLQIDSLMDPFMGSGTVLDIARHLRIKTIIGNDINPYSFLLNEIKYKYNSIAINKVYEDIEKFNRLSNSFIINYNDYSFNKMTKWYRRDISRKLLKIRNLIYNSHFNYPLILELALINVSLDFSNSRKSTSKLHIKKKEDIDKIDVNRIFPKFLDWIKEIALTLIEEIELNSGKSEIKIYNTNVLDLNIESGQQVDIIMTSPPYGDNKTTITYGQFSVLPLMWIRNFFNTEYEKNFSKIDFDSLGGSLKGHQKKLEILINNSITFKKLYLNIHNDQKKIFNKVITFLFDYNNALKKINTFLKKNGLLVLTLGNRKVFNTEIPLDKITLELLKKNYKFIYSFKRNIPYKTIPHSLTNKITGQKIKSISIEIILIFRKK